MAQRIPLEPVERRATADIIADLIRERIMDGTFTPGEQLGEVQLAEQLDVSRGPVREALQRLIQEGLLEGRPHRGVFVVSLDEGEVVDLYRVRGAVERAAVRLLCDGDGDGNLGATIEALDAIIDRMERAAGAERWARLAELDRQFHQSLVDGAQSKRLTRMFRTLLAETRLCLAALRPAYPRRADLVDEHRRILEALGAPDLERTLALVDEHHSAAIRSLVADGRT